mgnify:CR=1 FL=1
MITQSNRAQQSLLHTHHASAQYARTAQLLLAPGGRVIASTVAENGPLMRELFGAMPCPFKPAIPHLVYQ